MTGRLHRIHKGLAVLRDPYLNKGTAFSIEERDVLRLHGILPPHIGTLDEQASRRMEALESYGSDVQRYDFLRDLQDHNETLFYYVCVKHIERVMPLIYTPTVGEGCKTYSHRFWRPRGLFLSYPNKDRFDQIFSDPRLDDVEVIVVTDGERILGLGDQGAGGMGIPVGKLALYSACGGIHPRNTLPILLDVGTDNEERLKDPMYIGWRHTRLRGEAYDGFVKHFVKAVERRWPNVLLQWEDFARENALRLLNEYKLQICSFNDDIQGTAAAATATIISALRRTGLPMQDMRAVIVGAGSAGCGIAGLLIKMAVASGLRPDSAHRNFWLVDRNGLLLDDDKDLLDFQVPLTQCRATIPWCRRPGPISLSEVVENVKPHLLIGVSAQPGIFTETLVRTMATNVPYPIIMPLSNPLNRCEAQAQDLIDWTNGKAIVCLGSPCPPVRFPNGQCHTIDQTNNVYVFPGLGLGILAVKSRRVTDDMFLAAAQAVAHLSPEAKLDEAAYSPLLPPIRNLREVSKAVAISVAKEARAAALCDRFTDDEIISLVEARFWTPRYIDYLKLKGADPACAKLDEISGQDLGCMDDGEWKFSSSSETESDDDLSATTVRDTSSSTSSLQALVTGSQ